MIAPDTAAELKAERRFDLIAAALIGSIAVLAALLGIIQIQTGQDSNRAQIEAARLTADLTARLEISTVAQDQALVIAQGATALGFQGTAHEIAGLSYGDDTVSAIGKAENEASSDLSAALSATSATSGGSPLDAYTAGLLKATTLDLIAEVKEQNRQVDLANAASSRNTDSILGLSFLALAGVLTGLAAVLREGRAGWFALLAAVAMTCGAAALAVLAVI
jgi:hypothetical protein